MTTTGGGALTIANSSTLTISPTVTLSVSGDFMQTGLGAVHVGGALNMAGTAISFAGPILLTGNLGLNSAGGPITVGSDLNGPYALTVTAGAGDVLFTKTVSDDIALQSLTITANDIFLNGVGSEVSIMPGALTLTATDEIVLDNPWYTAHTQIYTAGTETRFTQAGLTTLLSNGGDISFGGPVTAPTGIVQLGSGTDLAVVTNGGGFGFSDIIGSNFENITINTGSGLAFLGALTDVATINTLTVNGGLVLLNGPMFLVNLSITSNTSIFNANGQVDITAGNDTFFNALTGDVGTRASPILVHTAQQIIAGAYDIASFDGTSIDDTVIPYPPNPPCFIYWNGVQIKECTRPPPPPPPPPPSPPPSPPSPPPSPPSDLKGSRFFAVLGMYDSQFTLANDYFFYTYLLNERFWRRSVPVYGNYRLRVRKV